MKRIKPPREPLLKDGQVVGSYRVSRALTGERVSSAFYEAKDLSSNTLALLGAVQSATWSDIEELLQQCQRLGHPALPKVTLIGELPDGHRILAVVPPRGIRLSQIVQESIQDQKPLGMRGFHLLLKVAEFFALLHEHQIFSLRLFPERIAVRFEQGEGSICNASLPDVAIPLLDAPVRPLTPPEDLEMARRVYYRSPDPELDVYILGVLAYECLLGHSPVPRRDYDDLRMDPPDIDHIPIEPVDPRMPVGVLQLVLRMLNRKSTAQPTMRQVCNELCSLLPVLGST